MGQAKQRGTFEERRAQAIARIKQSRKTQPIVLDAAPQEPKLQRAHMLATIVHAERIANAVNLSKPSQ